MICLRALFPILLVAGGLATASQATRRHPSNASSAHEGASKTAEPQALDKFLGKFCISCHSSTVRAGGLALDSPGKQAIGRHPETWERVVRKLRARQMPPVDRPRPDERSYEAISSFLESALDRAAQAHPDPGRTETLRRLTVTEYQNAIRDLLALEVDGASLLPRDPASNRFDNVTVGDLSPTLMERYVSAAQKISHMAVGTPGRSPGGDTFRLPTDRTQEEHVPGLPIGTRGGTLIRYTFPSAGEYEVAVRLSRDRNEEVEGLH